MVAKRHKKGRSHPLISPAASSAAVTAVMKANKKKNSRPEIAVRRALYRLGYRYRLYARDLPGNPDIVLRGRKKVIFVHGCFWHQHPESRCPLRSHPKSNMQYWGPKLRRNRERDRENKRKIAEMGWQCLTVWECELDNLSDIERKLQRFLANS
jgi:DNA mismatch endonuclease (patch repair protein)